MSGSSADVDGLRQWPACLPGAETRDVIKRTHLIRDNIVAVNRMYSCIYRNVVAGIYCRSDVSRASGISRCNSTHVLMCSNRHRSSRNREKRARSGCASGMMYSRFFVAFLQVILILQKFGR